MNFYCVETFDLKNGFIRLDGALKLILGQKERPEGSAQRPTQR
jgi:hypothetical protein